MCILLQDVNPSILRRDGKQCYFWSITEPIFKSIPISSILQLHLQNTSPELGGPDGDVECSPVQYAGHTPNVSSSELPGASEANADCTGDETLGVSISGEISTLPAPLDHGEEEMASNVPYLTELSAFISNVKKILRANKCGVRSQLLISCVDIFRRAGLTPRETHNVELYAFASILLATKYLSEIYCSFLTVPTMYRNVYNVEVTSELVSCVLQIEQDYVLAFKYDLSFLHEGILHIKYIMSNNTFNNRTFVTCGVRVGLLLRGTLLDICADDVGMLQSKALASKMLLSEEYLTSDLSSKYDTYNVAFAALFVAEGHLAIDETKDDDLQGALTEFLMGTACSNASKVDTAERESIMMRMSCRWLT